MARPPVAPARRASRPPRRRHYSNLAPGGNACRRAPAACILTPAPFRPGPARPLPMSSPLPRRRLLWLLPALAACLAAWPAADAQAPAAGARSYLFCFWNVENLFDDRPNPKLTGVDRDFD